MSYEDVYKNLSNPSWKPPESLASFLRAEVIEHPRVGAISSVLECGSGLGTVFESADLSPLQIKPDAVDISKSAIEMAKQRQANANFLVGDMTQSDFFLGNLYDLIIDSHLFHCLVRPSQRAAYLKNVIKHLKPETGIFALETMIVHKKMSLAGFDQQTGTLGGEYGRKIFNHLELEQELLEAGLRIEFLIFTSGLNMIPVPDRDEALITDPQIARALCSFNPDC